MAQDYIIVSCEPFPDANNVAFGTSFSPSGTTDKVEAVNTQGDGKYVYLDSESADLEIKVFVGNTLLSVNNQNLTGSPQTFRNENAAAVSGIGQWHQAWIRCGNANGSQGFVGDGEELENEADYCGWEVRAWHESGQVKIDVVKKIRV